MVDDESGDFSYYPSEAAMLEDLEYVDEAACILDREGNDYRLTMDLDRHLHLGPSLGTVEFIPSTTARACAGWNPVTCGEPAWDIRYRGIL